MLLMRIFAFGCICIAK